MVAVVLAIGALVTIDAVVAIDAAVTIDAVVAIDAVVTLGVAVTLGVVVTLGDVGVSWTKDDNGATVTLEAKFTCMLRPTRGFQSLRSHGRRGPSIRGVQQTGR